MTSTTSNDKDVTSVSIEDSSLPQAPDFAYSSLSSLVPMVMIFAVFYFLLLRPQEKRKKAQEALIAAVKRGDEVLTTSGIYGSIVKVNDSDHTVDIMVSENVVLKMMKSAIADKLNRDSTSETKKQVSKRGK